MSSPDPDIELAEMFADLARTLAVEHGDPHKTYDRICRMAVESIDGCESAGMSLLEGKRVDSLARTDAVPAEIDRIQDETQQGPCVDAIREHETFLTGRISQEQRWPEFIERARKTGIESILSFRLFLEQDTMGALNLYSRQTDAFDEHDQAVGAVFAAHAAVAMSGARREEQLQRKAETRDVIGQAKGIVMARSHLSEDDAFDVLRRASQRLNLKLRDVAERLTTGESLTSGQDDPTSPPGPEG